MTSSIYLDREEELLLERLAGMNQLSRNTVLRLALRELGSRADRDGRLPLIGRRPPAAPAGEGRVRGLG